MPAKTNILLVDDNPIIRGMLHQALAPLGQVTIAEDGADALLKAIESPPDLIITDFNMAGMDGRQLMTKLKGRPATSKISFILMAGKAEINERLKGVQDAVDDMLEK